MKRILLAALMISLPVCNLHAQWDLVGKVTTGSQFELTRTGHPFLSNDSTKIYFTGRGFLATYDIRTNTLTDFTRDFIFGDEGMTIDYARNRLLGIKSNLSLPLSCFFS